MMLPKQLGKSCNLFCLVFCVTEKVAWNSMQKATTNHQEIRDWIERNDGIPYLIDHPEAKADKKGLRINFPGYIDEMLLSESQLGKEISWEEFFSMFEEQQLRFLYEEPVEGVDPTRWYRFENRDTT